MTLIGAFNFQKQGDSNGVIYWLGTEAGSTKFTNPHESGKVRITSSGMDTNMTESTLVARKKLPAWTKDGPNGWISIDFGKTRALCLTHYTICNGSPQSGFDLLHWIVEGQLPNEKKWIPLEYECDIEQRRLNSPYRGGTYDVCIPMIENLAFRKIRIRSNGKNSSGTNALPICAFEVYGKFYEKL